MHAGERVSISVGVSQPPTAARAQNRSKGRCTGEAQHWRLRARPAAGPALRRQRRSLRRASTRTVALTDTRRWCERVNVSASQSRGHDSKTTADRSASPWTTSMVPPLDGPRHPVSLKKRFRFARLPSFCNPARCPSGAPGTAARPSSRAPTTRRGRWPREAMRVFAIDRLGYGDRHYERLSGSGSLLTPDGYIEMTTRWSPGSAPARTPIAQASPQAATPPARPVWLQLGAAIVEGFATRHHDIDGMIPMSWSTSRNSRRPSTSSRRPGAAARRAQGLHRVFLDGADGYSGPCDRFLFSFRG